MAPSTQMQALCALLFLYEHVVGRPLGKLEELRWARPRARLPVVRVRGDRAGAERGARPVDQEHADVAVAPFGDRAQSADGAAGVLPRREAEVGGEVTP